MLADLAERCSTIEESYEFMLAYAAQGHPTDSGSQSGGQIREYLRRAANAMRGLEESCATALQQERLEPAACYQAFFRVLVRDASDSLAAIELVLAQGVISSQVIDNLNASIHLRALLTDLFLLTEMAKPQPVQAKPTASGG
jgi:hypothetical protein